MTSAQNPPIDLFANAKDVEKEPFDPFDVFVNETNITHAKVNDSNREKKSTLSKKVTLPRDEC